MLEVIDSNSISTKILNLYKIVKGKKVIVAFSGGVDSSVLASLVSDVASETLLVMQIGDSVGIGEKEFAQKEAVQMGLQLKFISYEEYLESKEYSKNPHNRCYFCKSLLHSKLENLRTEMGFDIVVNGTNASDLTGHRPGYQAVLEYGAISPLVEVGLSKPEIRRIAEERKLNSYNKPATPCIASRIKTDVPINSSILREVRRAEDILRKSYGFKILRMRFNGTTFELELGKEERAVKMEEIQNTLKANGITRELHEIRVYKPYVPNTQ